MLKNFEDMSIRFDVIHERDGQTGEHRITAYTYTVIYRAYAYASRGKNKKLSCRREAARPSISFEILLSHSRSFKMTSISMACVSSY